MDDTTNQRKRRKENEEIKTASIAEMGDREKPTVVACAWCKRLTMDSRLRISIIVSLVAVLLALGHIIWPKVTIDAVSLTLIVIAILPWLTPLVKSLELPGGFKMEFQEKMDLLNSNSAVPEAVLDLQAADLTVDEDAPNNNILDVHGKALINQGLPSSYGTGYFQENPEIYPRSLAAFDRQSQSEKAKKLATEALQDFNRSDVSLSSIVEKTLRISTLLDHTYWRAWCKLQLMENGDVNAIRKFKEQFAPYVQNDANETQAVEKALMDYVESRIAPLLGKGKLFGSPLADLENSFAFFERGLRDMSTSIPTKALGIGEEQRKMLNGIRAKVRDYLIEIEKMEPLTARFEEWCEQIGAAVAVADPALTYAHEASRTGHFSNQGRFALLSLMQDGRVLISGIEAVMDPVQPGQPIPHANQLFPGGLAVMLSMNNDGAALATRAIVAWLGSHDDEIDAIRAEFSTHQAQKLR